MTTEKLRDLIIKYQLPQGFLARKSGLSTSIFIRKLGVNYCNRFSIKELELIEGVFKEMIDDFKNTIL